MSEKLHFIIHLYIYLDNASSQTRFIEKIDFYCVYFTDKNTLPGKSNLLYIVNKDFFKLIENH